MSNLINLLSHNLWIVAAASAIFSLLATMLVFRISLVRKLVGLQKQQKENNKYMMITCKYLADLSKKSDSMPKFNVDRTVRTDSAYQYAVKLFQSGRSIDEVVECCQLSWGEAELIQSLHAE